MQSRTSCRGYQKDELREQQERITLSYICLKIVNTIITISKKEKKNDIITSQSLYHNHQFLQLSFCHYEMERKYFLLLSVLPLLYTLESRRMLNGSNYDLDITVMSNDNHITHQKYYLVFYEKYYQFKSNFIFQ